MASTFRWWVLGALLGIAGVGLMQQRAGRGGLEAELATLQEKQRDAAALRAEHARLTAELPPPEALERWREDRAALARLQQEVAVLRRAPEPARPAQTPSHTEKLDTSERLRERQRVPLDQLVNRGWTTPRAAFETALWAAAHGEVETLAQGLVFDPRWAQQVDALWAGLSPATRAEYRSVERLFAALTISDVPLGTAQLLHESELKPGEHALPGPGHAFLVTTLTGPDKSTRRVALYFRPSDKGWQLVVPGAAVTKYREQLAKK